jgi:GPH family glycoside/pentoside/hexuronide:cation symporter
MVELKKNQESNYSTKKGLAYSFGQLPVIISYQGFTFLVFTFYFAVVGLNVLLISLGFLIWSIWNGLNDPFLGSLSDKTHTKWGRRLPWLMFSLIPIAIIMFLLFTPPITFGLENQITNFLYFIIIIIIFELFFSMFDINYIALLPEVFITTKERTKANNLRQTFAIIGLLVAFVLPTLFIPDLTNRKYLINYQIYGIVAAIIIIIGGLTFLKFSPKEKAEFKGEYKKAPNFGKSIKLCVKNRSFRWFIPAEIAMWCVYGILPTIAPLYGKFVLNIGEGESIFLALLLGLTFISAALFMNILWKPVVQKIGLRKTWLISLLIWIITLIPLMIIQDVISGLVVFFIIGIGLAGSLYIYDLIVADIIDEDEINTGTRREASYYGVLIFFQRLATIIVFLTISLVFTNVGWTIYEPEKVTAEVIFGLRLLICIFPAIALGVAIFAIYKYPLDGEYLKKVKANLQILHEQKKSKI